MFVELVLCDNAVKGRDIDGRQAEAKQLEEQ